MLLRKSQIFIYLEVKVGVLVHIQALKLGKLRTLEK